jgi:nucleoside phosphorylase
MAATSSIFAVEVILLCARFEEALEARKMFQDLQIPIIQKFRGKVFYHSVDFVDIHQHQFHVEIYSCTDLAGSNTASAVATSLLEHKNPHWIFMTGVCAGHPNKTFLGDVIVASSVVDLRAGKVVFGGRILHGSELPSINACLMDPIKDIGEKLKGQWSKLVRVHRPVSQRYKQEFLLQLLCLHREKKSLSSSSSNSAPGDSWGLSLQTIQEQLDSKIWQEGESAAVINQLSQLDPPKVTYCNVSFKYYLNDVQYREIGSSIGRGNYPKKDPTEPQVRVGVMATDSAVRADMSPADWTQMATELAQRDLVGLEMEASGLYQAVRLFNARSSNRVQTILIKGVSDLASPDKDDQYHSYGKRASAVFMYQFLQFYGYDLADTRQTTASASEAQSQIMKHKVEYPTEDEIRTSVFTKVLSLILCNHDERHIHIEREFMFYISIKASEEEYSNPQQSFDLRQRIDDFLHNRGDYKDPKKYLLLLGEGGSGKTMFCQKLIIDLIETYKMGDHVALYIPLNIIDQPSKNLMQCYFDAIGLTTDEIIWLKMQKILLIMDAYDEARQVEATNLYTDNHLDQWVKGKFIITTRLSHVVRITNYDSMFYPTIHMGNRQIFEKLWISPFDEEQRSLYVTQYVKNRTDAVIKKCELYFSRYCRKEANILIQKWADPQTYLDSINKLPPALIDLTYIPFFLRITMDILPEITDRHDNRSEKILHTKYDLLNKFMEDWFQREENRLLSANRISDGEQMIPKYKGFCARLAYRMKQELNGQGTYSVKWPLQSPHPSASESLKKSISQHNAKWEEFFGDTNILVRKGAPLKKLSSIEWAFIHMEIQEHFNTTNSVDYGTQVRAESISSLSVVARCDASRNTVQSDIARSSNKQNHNVATVRMARSPYNIGRQIPDLEQVNPKSDEKKNC